MSLCPRALLLLAALLFLGGVPLPCRAADTQADYDHAVTQARANAQNPTGYTATDLGVIGGPASGDGNTYVGGKLLVRTFTKESYYRTANPGKTLTSYGSPTTNAMWVTTGSELKDYWTDNNVTAADVHLETSRAMGMFSSNTNDIIFEILVDPDANHIQRPVKDPGIAAQPTALGEGASFVQPAGMTAQAYADFQTYYANWKAGAYGSSNFPWTQLGYTYLWGKGDAFADVRGLSEFIVPGGVSYTVRGIYSLQSYLYTAGEGSGDFNVTGAANTLWAGRNFQPTGNSVTIGAAGSISGGQGVLVSSPAYTVNNAGVISGATATKFGFANTANVALLFRGDTSDFGGQVTVPSGANTLINSGTIQSPGTAVRADAGDTNVTTSGFITGGDYAVKTGAGADSLTVSGGRITGAVDLGAGADTFATTGACTLAFAIDNASPTAPLQGIETASFNDATTLAVTFPGTSLVTSGASFDVVQATTLTATPANLAVTSNLPMYRLNASATGNTLRITATREAAYYGGAAQNTSLGGTLDSLASSGNAAMGGLIAALDASGDPAGNAGQLAPTTQTGAPATATGGGAAFSSAFSGRMQGLRAGASGGGLRGGGLAPAGFAAQGLDVADALFAVEEWQDRSPQVSPWQAVLPAAQQSAAGLRADSSWELFGDLFTHRGTFAAQGDTPGYQARGTGLMAGLGYRIFGDSHAGLVGGHIQSDTSYDASASETSAGDSRDRVWRFGPYASLAWDAWSLDAMLTYGRHSVRANRHIPFWGRTATAEYDMHDLLAYLGASRAFDLGAGFDAAPFVEGQYFHLSRDGYQERGAGEADLAVARGTSDSLTSVTGLRLGRDFELGPRTLRPEIWGGWRREHLDPAGDVDAAFAAAPSETFSTPAGGVDRDQARLGAGLTLSGPQGGSASLRLDGSYGRLTSDLSLSLGLRQTF